MFFREFTNQTYTNNNKALFWIMYKWNLIKGEFLENLFCNSQYQQFCFSEKNNYMLISFVFCFFITLIPNLKKFQIVSTISAVFILLTSNILNSVDEQYFLIC